MNEKRIRLIEKSSKERDMLLRIISQFNHNEDYYGRLEFLDRYGTGNITSKVLCVLKWRLMEEEQRLKKLLNEKQ